MYGISPRFASPQARMPVWVSFSHGVSTYVMLSRILSYSMTHMGGENITDDDSVLFFLPVTHNLGSETKRATGMPLFGAIGQAGSILGSHLYPLTEGPAYLCVEANGPLGVIAIY